MADSITDFDPVAYINEPRWQEVRLGLGRMTKLFDRMGRPQDRLKFVHVAGTNGKGSTCAYVASVLKTAGYRTGLFTSPYIIQFEERIRVNGANISSEELREVTLFVREHAEALAAEIGEHPTEFELMTAVAFEHFARSACDIVVCEVGLGGRLDSTNVIKSPEVCVITALALDHTDFLGDTLQAIAGEKAGIIKSGVPVVSWPQEDAGARQVIEDTARAHGCTVTLPDFAELKVRGVGEDGVRPFSYRGKGYSTRLLASYQPYNATVAIEVIGALRERGWKITDQELKEGIAQTSWPARFEVVTAKAPAIIVDGGHNQQGAAALASSLRDVFPDKPVTFIMSVLADKDYRAMIRAVLPLANAFLCVTPPNPRALSADDLAAAIQEEAKACDVQLAAVTPAPTFAEALSEAHRQAGPTGIICAFGSLYSLAEIKSALGQLTQ